MGLSLSRPMELRQQTRRGTPAFDVPGATVRRFPCRTTIKWPTRPKVFEPINSVRRDGIGRLTALTAVGPGNAAVVSRTRVFGIGAVFVFRRSRCRAGSLVREGRQESLRQFRSLTGAGCGGVFSPTRAIRRRSSAANSIWRTRASCTARMRCIAICFACARDDPVFASQRSDRLHGAVLGGRGVSSCDIWAKPATIGCCWSISAAICISSPAAEPLLALRAGPDWQLLWSSEDPRYGGCGTPPLKETEWYLPGHATLVLRIRQTYSKSITALGRGKSSQNENDQSDRSTASDRRRTDWRRARIFVFGRPIAGVFGSNSNSAIADSLRVGAPKTPAIFLASRLAPSPAIGISFGSTTETSFGPIRHRDFNPRAARAVGDWSIPGVSFGTTPIGPARRSPGKCFTKCTSARSRPKEPGRPRRANCRNWPRGNHRRRVDAGRGISRAIRLELRRRESVRPDASLRLAGRFSPLRR